ncbi:hypothetical protein [Acidovorax sp. NCPPB 3576]|uniref:hypothetical protein n=1 Tax=Acidovorax sp. NCPPB 3576 TaxID=2940488 RepID=UPI00234B7EB9|nr:hypothetical protein [Acidovorax sp. NCPPB 3576]WCM87211.1 hypothetical protein M5C98_17845 [Acidovorax sp. NCPPB 3576]
MTSTFSLTKLRNAMGSAGAAATPAPDAAPRAPSSKSKSSTGFGGLQGRENLAQSGGMAPRGRSPMTQAFSSAAQHARGAVNQFSQGMRQEVQQHKQGFSAFRAESHAASRPNFGYDGVAQNHRRAQAGHQQNAQRAYSQAAGHARAFFGETAHGVSQGARQAAYSLSSTMQRFDPRRLADKAARYGNAALHQATNVAMVGLGGALLAGAAVAEGVNAARYKVGQVAHSAAQKVDHAMYRAEHAVQSAVYRVDHAVQSAAHRVDHAMHRVDHAIQSAVNRAEYAVHSGINRVDNALHRADYAIHNAGHRIDQALQSAAHRVDYAAQTALHHATYPIRAAAHTYESLSHAASVFKQDMARFDPYRMSHQYQQYQARPQWY